MTGDLRMEALAGEVERILRQRGALLRNRAARSVNHREPRGGSKDTSGDTRGDIDSTFDVWDERLAVSGTRLAEAREALVEQLVEPAGIAYRHLAGRECHLGLSYNRSWTGELHDALREAGAHPRVAR
jgi:recombinational DNA repair ATPase RecF